MKYYLTLLFLTLISVSSVLLIRINKYCDNPATRRVDKNCNLESCKKFCSKAQHKVDVVKCENMQLVPSTNMTKKDYCLCCVNGENVRTLGRYGDPPWFRLYCKKNAAGMSECDCLLSDGEECNKYCRKKHGPQTWGYCLSRGMECRCQDYFPKSSKMLTTQK